jgi:hypothetical protein
MSAEFPYFHPSRKVQWGGSNGEADIEILQENWSAAAFLMTFAYAQGEAPAITLTNATAGSQGVRPGNWRNCWRHNCAPANQRRHTAGS